MTILQILSIVIGLLNVALSVYYSYKVDWKKHTYRTMNIMSGIVSFVWVAFTLMSTGVTSHIVQLSLQNLADFSHLIAALFMTLVIVHVHEENSGGPDKC